VLVSAFARVQLLGAKMFECPVCKEVDKDGRILQCDNGHCLCEDCYMSYVQHQKDAGRTPRCSICRLELLPTPIRNLALEQLIAAQKQATIAEVQQAAAAADAAAAAEEAQEVAAAAARLEELDKKEAEEAEKISYASAMAVAKAAGEGDVAEQAKMLAEYAKTPPARCAAPPAAPDWPEAPHWMSARRAPQRHALPERAAE
jgi:acyl-CoA reductase-like NAD-dependent aldehyde dehydrogenase